MTSDFSNSLVPGNGRPVVDPTSICSQIRSTESPTALLTLKSRSTETREDDGRGQHNDTFVASMTFANQHMERKSSATTDVADDDRGFEGPSTCDCDECGQMIVGRRRRREVPDAILAAIADYKRRRPLPLQQSRTLVKRYGRVSVWEWTLPWNAAPMVEFGGSHRLVWVQRLRGNGVLQRIGKGIAGSSAEEEGRVTLHDWKEGRVAWVPANGGQAVGYVHSDPKTGAQVAADTAATSNASTANTSTRDHKYATLIVAKLPTDLLDCNDASSSAFTSLSSEEAMCPPKWYEQICKATCSLFQTMRGGDAAVASSQLVIGTEVAELIKSALGRETDNVEA